MRLLDLFKNPMVLKFLCKESGSHDYTIYRKEAREELGLKIEQSDDALYAIIKAIYAKRDGTGYALHAAACFGRTEFLPIFISQGDHRQHPWR
jgi:hypothetical protein